MHDMTLSMNASAAAASSAASMDALHSNTELFIRHQFASPLMCSFVILVVVCNMYAACAQSLHVAVRIAATTSAVGYIIAEKLKNVF